MLSWIWIKLEEKKSVFSSSVLAFTVIFQFIRFFYYVLEIIWGDSEDCYGSVYIVINSKQLVLKSRYNW